DVKSKTINVHYVGDDRRFALEVGKRLKADGFLPLFAPEPTEGISEAVLVARIAKTERTALCWGDAKRAAIIAELNDSIISRWRGGDPDRRAVWLYVGGPTTPQKEEILEFGLGDDVEKIVDMRMPDGTTQVQ